MSATEYERGEQRSSVKITMNAKGEAQVEVKAYSHDLDTLDAARVKAVEVYKTTAAELRPTVPA